MRNYSDEDIERLLSGKKYRGEEDLLIIQPDGSRACVGWELTNGYHLENFKTDCEVRLTDEELLASAYKNLERSSLYRK